MSCNDLRDMCGVHRLPMSGCKDNLIRRLQPFTNALSNFDEDKVDGNESSENSKSDGY